MFVSLDGFIRINDWGPSEAVDMNQCPPWIQLRYPVGDSPKHREMDTHVY